MNSYQSCSISLEVPSFHAWMIAISVHGGITLGFGLPLGMILFCFSRGIAERKNSRRRNSTTTTTKIVALTIGIVTAITMAYFPSFLIDNYLLNNKSVVDDDDYNREQFLSWMVGFLASAFGFTIFFKSMAVAFDHQPTLEETAKKEEANENNMFLSFFIYWFLALPEPIIEKGKFRRTTSYEIREKVIIFLSKILGLTVVLSILHYYNTNDDEHNNNNNNTSIPLMIRDGFFHTWLLYLWLSFCLDLGTILNLASTGYSCCDGFNNPLLASRCFREVWGTRWNLPIHKLLKRSIYQPLQKRTKGNDKMKKLRNNILTFFVSGLIHEYTFSIHNTDAYEFGYAILFFVLMGCCMIIEEHLWKTMIQSSSSLPYYTSKIPSWIISTILVLIVSIPVELFFIKSWLQVGIVPIMETLFPYFTIVC